MSLSEAGFAAPAGLVFGQAVMTAGQSGLMFGKTGPPAGTSGLIAGEKTGLFDPARSEQSGMSDPAE